MSNSKMRHKQVRGGVFRKAVCCVAVLGVAAFGMLLPGTIAGQAGTPPKAAQETKPAREKKPASAASPTAGQARPAPSAAELETWRQTILHTKKPKKSCYVANYPDKAWTEVTCIKPPNIPQQLPLCGAGNGNNSVGKFEHESGQGAATGIVESEGSFDNATGVTSECGVQCSGPNCPSKKSCTGLPSNAFSLQLNTQFFPTAKLCSDNKISDCEGWEQFVFSNSQCGLNNKCSGPPTESQACVYIQYWLYDYSSKGTCPSSSWQQPPQQSSYCFINSTMATPVPQQVVTNAELQSLKLTGASPHLPTNAALESRNPSGQNGSIPEDDTVTLTIGSTVYSASGDDYFPDLASKWQYSEFNILGDGCGSQAWFNPGTTLQVRTLVDSATSGPSCSHTGCTGESNNLELGLCSAVGGASPGIAFTEALSSPPVGNTVVLYNPDAGQADVVGFDGAGNQIRDVPQSGWRTTWDKAVVGDFIGETQGKQLVPQILLYDRTAGQADVVGFNSNGDENLDAQNPVFGTTWDIIVAGDFLGIGREQVLLYDRTAGQAALVAFNSKGVASKPVLCNGFPKTWDKIVAGDFLGVAGQQQVLLYDHNAGRIDLVAFDSEGGVSMDTANNGLSTLYDKIVPGYFLGDEKEQVVLYGPSAGRLDLMAFDSKGGVSMDTPNKGFRASYDKIVAGYFTGETRRYGVSSQRVHQILLYDRTAGEADVVAFDTKGHESLDAPNKGLSTSYDKIVVGDFIGRGNGQQQVVLYDRNAGEADVLAFDTKGRVSLGGRNNGYRRSRDMIVAGAFLGK
jgi:hypothetical protein